MLFNYNKRTFTEIVFSDLDKLGKKLRTITNCEVINDKIYVTGSTGNYFLTLGIYDIKSKDLTFKVFPKKISNQFLLKVEETAFFCWTEKIGKGLSNTFIARIEDDLMLSDETLIQSSSEGYFVNLKIKKTKENSYLIIGTTSTTQVHYEYVLMTDPKVFWAYWNTKEITNKGELKISDSQLTSNFYSKEQKEDIKKSLEKTYYYHGGLFISDIYTNKEDDIIIIVQDEESEFYVLSVNSDLKLNWDKAIKYTDPEVAPNSVNIEKVNCYAKFLKEENIVNITYFENKKLKSMDVALDNGSIIEEYTSENVMVLAGKKNTSVPLNFALKIEDYNYLVFQIFEHGSKFTLDNSEYTRNLYIRHLLVN